MAMTALPPTSPVNNSVGLSCWAQDNLFSEYRTIPAGPFSFEVLYVFTQGRQQITNTLEQFGGYFVALFYYAFQDCNVMF